MVALLHEPPLRRRAHRRGRPGGQARRPRPRRRPETPEEQKEDAEMAAYNDYLAQLAEQDKASGR